MSLSNKGALGKGTPLRGIRALERSEIWAGPYCGCLLTDMGAEVIKVESIQRIARGPINPPRNSGMYPEGEAGERPWNRQANFNALNRNKKGITLDLKTNDGAKVFKDLATTSDIIFCNYSRTVMEEFGLGYSEIVTIKPDIIYMLMPGYGNTGPYKDYRSMGMAIDAITGHSHLRGYPDFDHSSNSLVHHPNAAAAVNATLALSTALVHRSRTGKGQFIDMSQAESFMTHMGEIFLEYQIKSHPRERQGNRHPGYAPQGTYRCKGEDKWVAISVVTDKHRESLSKLMELNAMQSEKYDTVSKRITFQDELDKIISEWTSNKDRYNVMTSLQTFAVPAGVVIDCGPDTYNEPHLIERDFFQVVDHPDAGIFPMTGPVLKFFNGCELVKHDPSPCLGEHNNYVLRDVLGYPTETIRLLESKSIIGTEPLLGSDSGGSRRATKEYKR